MQVKYKTPLMLITTLTLVVVVKLLFPAPIKNTELRNEFWLRKTHSTQKVNVVVGGDSRVYRGFSIVALENKMGNGLNGVNLGYSSAGYSQEYLDFLVSRLTKNEKRYLVLGLSPHSFTLDAAKNDLYYQYKQTSRFELFKGLYLSRYLKHFAPYKISEWRDCLLNIPPESFYDETFTQNGWVRSNKIPEDTLTALDIYENLFTKYQVEDSLVTDFFLEIDTIVASGVTVIAFRPPTFDSMSNLEDSLSGYDEAFIKDGLEKRGCVWMSFDNADFHTYDGSHLHYESAEKLAEQVGELIHDLEKGD